MGRGERSSCKVGGSETRGRCPSLRGSNLVDMWKRNKSEAQDGKRKTERPLSLKHTTCFHFLRVSSAEITLRTLYPL